MKGKFRSISFKIWRILGLTLIVFFTLTLFLTFQIIEKVKKDTIFLQFETVAKTFEVGEIRPGIVSGSSSSVPWIAEFRVEKRKESTEIGMVIPRHRPGPPPKDDIRTETIDIVLEDIQLNKGIKEKKVLVKDTMHIFYQVFWEKTPDDFEREEVGLVLFTTLPVNNDIQFVMFSGVFALLVFSFFASKIIASKIVAPVLKLQNFSNEVAKRNWNAKLPEMDNDEIGLLAKTLEQMKDSLRIAEQRDREFLQSTSHDLKTPVMIIKGYAQSMIDGIKINSEKSEAEVIKTEAEKLERRITQLLKLNTISHSLEYSENRSIVRVDRVLNNLISRFKVIKPELRWITDLKEFEINGDSEALLIAFENIIENQLRYAETLIYISMEAVEENEKITIVISNDGPQFELEDPMALFEIYKKDREGQFGLGLSIVRQVIDSHDGIVTASNTDNGVEFRIKL